jgi:hypothetical protein
MNLFKHKNLLKYLLSLFLFCNCSVDTLAQNTDSTQAVSTFSGSVGITNNGFSIIPTFSLNDPAVIINLAWRKKRLSFEPDIRLVPDATKGSLLFWLRYRLIEKPKFTLRAGVHPAFSLIRRNDTEDGVTKEVTEMLRFAAFEIVPSYQINEHFGIGAMYLQGKGLQKHGPQTTNVLFLNTNISNIGLSKNLKFSLFPSVFFLHTDGARGNYLTVTGVLAHKKMPFTIQSTINQTLTSNIPNNQYFMWNVSLNYNFKKTYKRISS